MASELEYAWAAGFLDGEGWFGVTTKKGYSVPTIEAAQVGSAASLQRLQGLFGGSIQQRKTSGTFVWKVQGAKGVRPICWALLPHLSVWGRRVAVLMIFCDQVKPRGVARYSPRERAQRDAIRSFVRATRKDT